MLRWMDIEDEDVLGMTVKMYRPSIEIQDEQRIENENLELDHYAYKYLGSELLMYRILDANFEQYIEERGDIARLKQIRIPIERS